MTAAPAVGVVLTALPAQSAVAGGIIYDAPETQRQAARLRDRAANLDHTGDHSAAQRARSEADSRRQRVRWCVDTETNV
ncbi:hypothetical protein ACSNOK_18580 [Streptomyces sp. URMC 126]|uniref:hypothetical protein n=1 Tax=Streptomyces sp. URMC 126 TaxID=3423401 RepID=UPI003F1E3567